MNLTVSVILFCDSHHRGIFVVLLHRSPSLPHTALVCSPLFILSLLTQSSSTPQIHQTPNLNSNKPTPHRINNRNLDHHQDRYLPFSPLLLKKKPWFPIPIPIPPSCLLSLTTTLPATSPISFKSCTSLIPHSLLTTPSNP